MRIDADVLEAFKATGQGLQTRINAALREAVAHGLSKAQCLSERSLRKKGSADRDRLTFKNQTFAW
jgi:hypothetical protein